MSDARRRAIVAAVVGVFGASVGIAGAGHLYLREWRRASAWFAFVLGVGITLLSVFTDPAALTMATIGDLPPTVTGPVFALLFLSTFDAYRVAISTPGRGDELRCPVCGGELDAQVTFCPWCATEFERPPLPPEEFDGNGGRDVE